MSQVDPTQPAPYRGRLAPSPTGYLHLGHAKTFWTAQQRARAQNGVLVLRNEDLDRSRCRPEFVRGVHEDLHWFDFVIWRHDDVPAYQLAVVVDDAAMRITEVVRGEDLLRSTARQILVYRALGLESPRFYHCSLLCDESGQRLAKRHDALSLRALR